MDGIACRATSRTGALHDSTQQSSSASACSSAVGSSSPPFHVPALLRDRTVALASGARGGSDGVLPEASQEHDQEEEPNVERQQATLPLPRVPQTPQTERA